MTDKVVFHLARYAPEEYRSFPSAFFLAKVSLYERFKRGIKSIEHRWLKMDKGLAKSYWILRLCRPLTPEEVNVLMSKVKVHNAVVNMTQFLKVKRAWLVESYPKGLLPRLEADIKGIYLMKDDEGLLFIDTVVKNVKEVTE